MNVAAWIVTGLLVGVFTVSGVAKSTMSRDRLIATGQTGIAPFPMPLVRVVALCELLAVVGLLAPWLTDTARFLTPTAAIGLGIVMMGAATSHASLKEPGPVAANVLLLSACAFVAAERFAALN
ncbi:DoxX-like protein [Kribbella orskensis]|uniref:DoxX-like protein n=1 Tax=Kribbella orskensis TaxID=2512216 RepID=A0ABY2BSA3_9ACTN|nr:MULTISPECIES: DoxX family protein [Kribbella]TCN42869.1 DoxX-like protein [Kribbella sp. VKM Ac-2500]TCO29775.1 DoxX-like protein [Kribbella orskensis]